jgi:pilus assembly protein CpaF
MERLISLGSISEEAARFLRQMVCARYNIFISGGTSSGKTTFLNALSDFIPPEERIITIEDSAELQITGIPNLIRMEARNSNTTGAGAITIQNLIRTSLRMRPDRIIVGEVRGAEALDMLNAMNTGHDGSLSTGHANSSRDMLRRLETMVMQGGSGLPLPAVRRNVASSIDILVHLGKIGSRKRAVLEICEIAGMQGEEIALNLLFQRREGRLLPTGSELRNREKLDLYGERHEPSF